MKKSYALVKPVAMLTAFFCCLGVFAADGVWTNRVSGNWGNAANWQGGTVAGAGGKATLNLAGADYTVSNQGTVTLSGVTLNASVAGRTVFVSGGTVELVAPAVVDASNSSHLSFKGTTVSSSADLLITGLGRLFLGSDNLLSGRVIISNGNLRAVNDSAFGPPLGALVADAITLDGGGLMNDASDANLVIAPNRGITLTPNNGYLGCGYLNAGTKINSPITGPGFLGINYERSRVFLGNSANNYSGGTRIGTTGPGANSEDMAVLVLDDDEVLPDAGGLMVGGESSFMNNLRAGVLDLNGKTETVNTLTSGPRAEITSSVAGQGRLIVGGADDDIDYRGTLTGGATITKQGTGDISLRGAGLARGTVEVEGGLLLAGGINLGRATVLFDGGNMRLTAPSGLYEYTAPSPNLPDLSADLTYTGWQLWPIKGSERSPLVFPLSTQFVYKGRWNVAEAGTYSFAKAFDDGGYLEIDGVPIIHKGVSSELYVAGNIALTAGWHDIEIRYAQGGGGVGPAHELNNGIMYDPLNGGFTSTVERARARMFTDDGGPHVIATGRDNTLEATLVLNQDATMTVDETSDTPVFAGVVTTNSAGLVLTIDNNGAPVRFGSADALAPAVLDAEIVSSGGLTLSDNLWLRSLPSIAYTLTDGMNLFLDGNDLLSGALVLSNYSATIVAGTTIGGDGTATVLNGNTLSFSTLRFVDGALLDVPGNLLNATTDFSLADSKAVFTGAGSMTYSGNFTGSGTVEKQGSGTVELTGTGSALNGTITVAGGTLVVGSESLLGGADVTLAGGALSNKEGSDLTLNTTALAAGSGGFHVTPGETMTVNSAIIGSGAISKTGLGTLVLGGSEFNTGLDLTVIGGALHLNKSGMSNAYGVDNLTVGAGASATLAGASDNQINGDLTLSGGTLELNGRSEALNTLRSVDSNSTVVNNGAAAQLTVGNGDGNSAFQGTLRDGSGALSLRKVGGGTMTMAAESIAYSGSTDVNAGTLRLMPSALPNIVGLSYQLDAVNPGAITLSGSRVVAWKDSVKSSVVFRQSVAALQPSYVQHAINGLPAVRFSDSARNRLASETPATAQTVFILAQTTSFGSHDGIFGVSGSDYGIRGLNYGAWLYPGNVGDFTQYGSMYINGSAGSTYDVTQPYILTALRSAPHLEQKHALGDYWNYEAFPRYFRGFIGEVLVYDRALDASERAAVEGYLTKKWLALPAGLAYRLDAANPATITLDGSKVAAWADATGAGVNFSQETAALQPEYVEGAINGLPAVRFGSYDSPTRLVANKSARARTVFIVSKMRKSVGLAGVWGQSGSDTGLRHNSPTSWRHTGNGGNEGDFSINGAMYINGIPGFSFAAQPLHIVTAVSTGDKDWKAAVGDYWGNPTYNRYFNGDIGEILVYNRVLTTAERERVDRFLTQKWLEPAPAMASAATLVTIASGATLAVAATDTEVAAVAGTGVISVESCRAIITNYIGFTGTVTGNGTLAIAAADGADATFTPASLDVTICNDSAMAANLVVDGAGDTCLMGSLQDGKSALGFVHSGSGKTRMSGHNSTYTGDTLLEAGVASVGSATQTRYVRFSPSVMRVGGEHYGSGCQYSEFQLLLDGVHVQYPAGTLGTSPGGNSATEGPDRAVDNNLGTKFYSVIVKPLIVVMPESVLFNGYRWYTANDATGRDPLSWTVDISADGESWSTVDSRDYSANAGAITTARGTLANAWYINSSATEMNVLSDLSRTMIAAPAELAVVLFSETIGPLSGEGQITLTDGTLGLNAFESAAFGGNISGSGTIVKQGAAKQSLSGAINVIGEIVVEAGVLDLGGAVLTGITNIVIQAGGELTGAATVNGDLTITYAGGPYRGTLAVSSALTVSGTVTLALPEGAGYPLHQTLFTYASADQATQAALVGAILPPGVPTGYNAQVRVTESSARFVAASGGILMIIR
ncbi:MAG: hypothetical protein PHO37_01055 [Kiritimatiellae bacterium]|nr:hypothetical protein [Kiritimatiellia bacterium]